jgi:transcriptional antiterminator RfaH
VTEKREPLFPGYLFIALDLSQGGWRSINASRGVVRLLAHGYTPVPVPIGMVEALVVRTDVHGSICEKRDYQLGESVRIVDGPLANLVGTISRVSAAGRIRVLLDLLSNSVSVSVRSDSLESAA